MDKRVMKVSDGNATATHHRVQGRSGTTLEIVRTTRDRVAHELGPRRNRGSPLPAATYTTARKRGLAGGGRAHSAMVSCGRPAKSPDSKRKTTFFKTRAFIVRESHEVSVYSDPLQSALDWAAVLDAVSQPRARTDAQALE